MKQEHAGPAVCDRITAEQPLLIDKRQVAAMTSLSVRTIERLVSQGRFMPPIRLGRKMMWHREKFIAWLANGAVLPPRNNLRGIFESRAESP
jgi:predicted DNA-binding transcriptional regulator AlpA